MTDTLCGGRDVMLNMSFSSALAVCRFSSIKIISGTANILQTSQGDVLSFAVLSCF